MQVAVVTFPGSNCDEDAVHVLRNVLGVATATVWHKETRLPPDTAAIVLPGGFSYGDALRSGAIARFSPVMSAVQTHAEQGGKVLGICNGFQILLESGLLPGAMLQNTSRKFVCRNVELAVTNSSTAFSSAYSPLDELRVPVAHHEGCYFAPPPLLRELEENDRIVFKYRQGHNPNGSTADIAGIINAKGNVMGMMPHPERASEPLLGSNDGRGVFESLVR
ncbi:MAG: phosphoribosylformylglycinamidine synthase subunit PurQ, partial [Myxococcota bacterium]